MKCIENEIPFEVPTNWAWARLRNICMMAAGKAKPANQIKATPFEGGFPCFGGNGIRGYVDEYNQEGTFSIIGRQGALCGNINTASGKFYATEHAVVTTLFSGIDFNWSNYILEAMNLNKYATGAAQPGLSVANVLNVFVPVPPTQEQERIGKKILESIKIINIIKQEKLNLQTIVSNTKAKILDLAIRGKLVPQNSTDEPASALLERIRQEKEELIKQGKIKRDKKESIIFKGEDNSYYEKIDTTIEKINDEIPFELPVNWMWCRFSEVIELFSGQDLTPDRYSDIPQGIPYLTGASNLERGHVIINRWTSAATTHATIGDLLLIVKGSGVGKMAICNIEDAHIARQIMALRCRNGISQEYLQIVVSAFLTEIIDQANGIIPGIRREVVLNTLFPLPPSSEQLRISAKVKRITDELQTIEKCLS